MVRLVGWIFELSYWIDMKVILRRVFSEETTPTMITFLLIREMDMRMTKRALKKFFQMISMMVMMTKHTFPK